MLYLTKNIRLFQDSLRVHGAFTGEGNICTLFHVAIHTGHEENRFRFPLLCNHSKGMQAIIGFHMVTVYPATFFVDTEHGKLFHLVPTFGSHEPVSGFYIADMTSMVSLKKVTMSLTSSWRNSFKMFSASSRLWRTSSIQLP